MEKNLIYFYIFLHIHCGCLLCVSQKFLINHFFDGFHLYMCLGMHISFNLNKPWMALDENTKVPNLGLQEPLMGPTKMVMVGGKGKSLVSVLGSLVITICGCNLHVMLF